MFKLRHGTCPRLLRHWAEGVRDAGKAPRSSVQDGGRHGGTSNLSGTLLIDISEQTATTQGGMSEGAGQQDQSEPQRGEAFRIETVLHSGDQLRRGDAGAADSSAVDGEVGSREQEGGPLPAASEHHQEQRGSVVTLESVSACAGDGPESYGETSEGTASSKLERTDSAVHKSSECSEPGGLDQRQAETSQGQEMSGPSESSGEPPAGGPEESKERSRDSKHVTAAWETLVRWGRFWRNLHKGDVTDALTRTSKICVFGGGSFGTAMAVMLARNKASLDVVMLVRDPQLVASINSNHLNTRYMPNHPLPPNVRATTDPAEAIEGAQYAIHAVPVQQSAAFLKSIALLIPASLPIVSVSKGLEVSTLETMAELIPRALGRKGHPVAVLSGPSFSVELMDKKPTGLVAASRDPELARACQQLLASKYLRINTTRDVLGVEMAGALKNVLAIAAGIVEGMGLGNNCMAALVAQGCAEIRWLAEKMGAKPATLAGLSGTGDIMLTCFVSLSRNRSVGVRLGSGEKLDDILASMSQVAEGVATAGAVIALARKYRVSMPVLTAVARILENELTPKKAVLELMSLPQVEEV
ncbi:NAD-dependent Glycerol-3-Phosphate Dehydrogenase [Klebsormidium nitens]|uniref:Glycerol-3-phosphate dehydrogenase [NAD(+)] n=1 Tax=Klebsormidium nitens TaxID=105231 RepID=A0A1Y1IRI1_KLENI|nr:NAD-dependent Glycerol-3-Phosphate Dehydrogenase [Klebsormidium nitens]|eukprot:GAQ91247.1 NAD-dependent Glycerol-3-Phosphate Dehydrogenase [Klebsormidium nitens]